MQDPAATPHPPAERTWLRLVVVVGVVGSLFAVAALWDPGAGTTRDVDVRNGRAFIQDNLWTVDGAQYAVWVDGDSMPVLGRRVPGGEWTTTDLAAVPGNPLAAPTVDDEHNVYVVAVDAQRHVHVAGNMHSDPLRYVRTARPGDLERWVQPPVGGNLERVTYPSFVSLTDGTLLFLRREGSGDGGGQVVVDRLPAGTTQWQHQGVLIDGVPTGDRPYLNRIAVDPDSGTIHMAWVWRERPTFRGNTDVGYMRSVDGGRTWTTTSGRPLRVPVTRTTAETAWARGGDDPPLNSGGMVTDGDGRPHLVLHQGGALLHLHHDGDRWIAASPLGEFSSRPTLARGHSGSVWAVGVRGQRLRAEQVHPEVGPTVDGPRVSRTFEPTVDTQLMNTEGRVEILVPVVGDEVPTVVTMDLP